MRGMRAQLRRRLLLARPEGPSLVAGPSRVGEVGPCLAVVAELSLRAVVGAPFWPEAGEVRVSSPVGEVAEL